MTIRPAKPGEVTTVLALCKELNSDPAAMDHPRPMTEKNLRTLSEFITKLIEEDPHQVVVAEEDGELIGYLMFQRIAKSILETDRPWAAVSDLYVRPAYRRRGIGKKLLQTCFDDSVSRARTATPLLGQMIGAYTPYLGRGSANSTPCVSVKK